MSTLEIYDSEGNAYRPQGSGGRKLDRVQELFRDGIRFAIENQRSGIEAFLYFRAKETHKDRSEQFYARYRTESKQNILRSITEQIEQRVESEWNHIIDSSVDIYQQIARGRFSPPELTTEPRILKQLASTRHNPVVGVRDEAAAVGLLHSIQEGKYINNIAIAKQAPDSASGWDLIIVPNGRSGVVPLGDTKEAWKDAKEDIRQEAIQDQINSIQSSVNTLSSEYGLSDSEIRTRLKRAIPTLKEPRSPPKSSDSAGKMTKGSNLLSTAQGVKDLGVAAIAVLLLVGLIGVGSFMLGVGPVGDLLGGGGSTDENLMVSGQVVEDSDRGVPIENAEVVVTLQNPVESDEELMNETETDGEGRYDHNLMEFGDEIPPTSEAEVRVEVAAEGYEPASRGITNVSSSESREGIDFELRPEAGNITGTVVDSEGEPLDGERVDFEGPSQAEVDTDENGEFVQELDPGEYTITITHITYENKELEETVEPGETTDLGDIVLESE